MLGEVAREALDIVGEFDHLGQQRIVGVEPGFLKAAIVHLLAHLAPHDAGERRRHVFRQAHHLAHFAHGGAAAIGDDRGGQPGALAAIAGIDILDHLLAPLMLEVDVDVGGFLALLRDEALEQQFDLVGVDRRDPDDIADSGIGGRPPPLG